MGGVQQFHIQLSLLCFSLCEPDECVPNVTMLHGVLTFETMKAVHPRSPSILFDICFVLIVARSRDIHLFVLFLSCCGVAC